MVVRPFAQQPQRLAGHRAGQCQRKRERRIRNCRVQSLGRYVLGQEHRLVRARVQRRLQHGKAGRLNAHFRVLRHIRVGIGGYGTALQRPLAAAFILDALLTQLAERIAAHFVEQRRGQEGVFVHVEREINEFIGHAAGFRELRTHALNVCALRERLLDDRAALFHAVSVQRDDQANRLADMRAQIAADVFRAVLAVHALPRALHLCIADQAIELCARPCAVGRFCAHGFARRTAQIAHGVFLAGFIAEGQRISSQYIARQADLARRGQLAHGKARVIGLARAHQLAVDQAGAVALRKAAAVEDLQKRFLRVAVRLVFAVAFDQVERLAVDARDLGDILAPLEPPLDFQAGHAAFAQRAEMIKRHKILRGEQIAAALHRALKPVGQAAGLRAPAAIAAAPADQTGEETLSRAGHAQRAVDERFQLDALARAFSDFVIAHLARQHDAVEAGLAGKRRALAVVYGHLRAGMQRQRGQNGLQKRCRAQILHNGRVRAGMGDLFGHVIELILLAILEHGVDGHMDARAALMGVIDGALQPLTVEISRADTSV